MAARSLYTRTHPDVDTSKLIIYTTTQTHSFGKKAALILGLQDRALEVTAEDKFSLRGSTLRAALEEDKQAGLHPFVLGEYNSLKPNSVPCRELGQNRLPIEGLKLNKRIWTF